MSGKQGAAGLRTRAMSHLLSEFYLISFFVLVGRLLCLNCHPNKFNYMCEVSYLSGLRLRIVSYPLT